MKKATRILTLVLAILMLIPMVASCKKNDAGAAAGSDTTVSTGGENAGGENGGGGEGENLSPDEICELPADLYFGDNGVQNFTVLVRSDRARAVDEFYVDPEKANKSVVDEAVYTRELVIEDALGINFCYQYSTMDEMNQEITIEASSPTGAFDVAAQDAFRVPSMVLNGVLYDWNKIPYVNTSKVWWSSRSGMAEELTLYGQLNMISGDASNLAVGKYLCMYFNKNLLEIYAHMKPEDLYEIVNNGQWTIDKLLEMTAELTTEIDGVPGYGPEDLWGNNFYIATITDGYFAAFDIPITQKYAENSFEVNLNTPRMIKAVEKLHAMCYENNRTYMTEDKGTSEKFFANGHAIFTHGGFEWAVDFLTGMSDPYGIIPYPKLDEEQESYGTMLSDVYSMFVVPLSCTNPEFVGGVMEKLAYESYHTTTVAYYDLLLKGRAAQDYQSREMLDMIHDTLQYNLGYTMSSSIGNPVHAFRSMLKNSESNTWSSFWQNNGKKYNQQLQNLLDNAKIKSEG